MTTERMLTDELRRLADEAEVVEDQSEVAVGKVGQQRR